MTEFTKENKELKEFVDATRPTGICEICTSNVISRYERLQAENSKQKIAIANQGKIINQYQKQSTDLQYELDTVKNNPEAEKYYFEKWTELKQRIEELEQERRWIPVSEKPKSGVPVLVWNGGVHTAFWDARKDDLPFGGNWVWYPVRNKMYSYVGGVRYWQPLPQPPQEAI